MNSMPQSRNLLILKGSVPWKDVLNLLDNLLKKATEISELGAVPLPYKVFSLICVSGDKSRGQKSTDECRKIMNFIQRNSSCLVSVPSSFGSQNVEKALREHLREPAEEKYRCEIFMWNFHRPDEPTNYITSYNYDPTRPEEKNPSVSELFFQALWTQEYPDHAQETFDHPFHGLIMNAKTSKEFHNSHICLSFRVPARDDREAISELDALKKMDVDFHFPFIVSRRDAERSSIYNIASANEIMLEAAAQKLGQWLRVVYKKTNKAETIAEPNSPGSKRMSQAETIVENDSPGREVIGRI